MNNKVRTFVYIILGIFGVIIAFQSYYILKLNGTLVKKAPGTDSVKIEVKNEDAVKVRFTLAPMPPKMDFCEEEVPMNDQEVFERMEFEWVSAQNRTTANWMILKRSTRYFPIIEPILKQNGLPDDFKYLAVAESNLANVTSPANAEGFWQFLAETGQGFGLEINKMVDERYDVAKATQAACNYLTAAYETFGSWTLAAASYNMGQGGLADEIDFQKQNNYYKLRLNSETSKYVFRIITWKYIISNPASIGMEWDAKMGQQLPLTRKVEVTSSIPDLVDWSIKQGTDYKTLKYLNPWLRSDKLEVRGGKTYTIQLPVK